MDNHITVTIAGAQGHPGLSVFEPVIIRNILQSCELLTDSGVRFACNMVDGLRAIREHIAESQA